MMEYRRVGLNRTILFYPGWTLWKDKFSVLINHVIKMHLNQKNILNKKLILNRYYNQKLCKISMEMLFPLIKRDYQNENYVCDILLDWYIKLLYLIDFFPPYDILQGVQINVKSILLF